MTESDWPAYEIPLKAMGPGYAIPPNTPPLGKDWFSFARAYADAGQELRIALAKECEDDLVRPSDNLLVLPTIFLYRHFIELALKLILIEADKETPCTVRKKYKHDLAKLWCDCRPVMKSFADSINMFVQRWGLVEQAILEMHDFDEKEIAFRYPTKNLGNVNVSRLSRNMFLVQFLLMEIAAKVKWHKDLEKQIQEMCDTAAKKKESGRCDSDGGDSCP